MSVHKMDFVVVNNMAPRTLLSARRVRDRWNGATCTIFPAQGAIVGSAATPDG
jgi:hypothetical protein